MTHPKDNKWSATKIERKIIAVIDDLNYLFWEELTPLEKLRHVRESFYPILSQSRQEFIKDLEGLKNEVDEILKGIDKDECESDEGWWETSTGAKFGIKKKEEINQKISQLLAKYKR